MLGKIALTNDWVRRVVVAMALGMYVLSMTYIVARARAMQRIGHEFMHVQLELSELQKHHMSQMNEAVQRMDTLERVLFGDVVAKLEKAKEAPAQARVQLWQKNRDQELRERIRNLEYWRNEIEQGYRR